MPAAGAPLEPRQPSLDPQKPVTSAPPPQPDIDETSAAASPPRSWYRRFYDWVLHWAYTPYAMTALFVLSFAESSFFPIPPDVLLIPLVLGKRTAAWSFAFWCSVASVLGGIAGYALGYFLWTRGVDQICFDYIPGFTPQGFAKVEQWYKEYDFWIVFIAGFTPVPYKIITVTAGVFELNFGMFVLASAVSRSARFFLVAALLRKYGPPIQNFIEKRLGMVMIVFCVLLVGGFVAFKILLQHD